MRIVLIFSLIVLPLISTSDTHKDTDGKIIFQSDLKLIDPVICVFVNYFFSLGEVDDLGELLITLRKVDKDGIATNWVTIVDRIPLRKQFTLNWNHYERTIRHHEAQLFIIEVVQTQSSDSQATAVLLDVSFDKNVCSVESPTTESTSGSTDHSPCCIDEPCICVYSGSILPSSLIVSAFVESEFDEIHVKSIDDGSAKTESLQFDDNLMIIKNQINEIKTVPDEHNYDAITSTVSNKMVNVNLSNLLTEVSPNDIETVTESTLYLITNQSTTLINEINKETFSPTTDATPETTELIQPTSTDNQLINSSVITVDEIINPDSVNIIKIANLGYDLFRTIKLFIKQRILIFSISALVGLIFLVICVTFAVLTRNQREDRRFDLVPATGLELNTITFHRRTINSNILQILSDYRKYNESADLNIINQ